MKLTKISLPVWKKNEPLSKYSYIRMGGPADFFTVAKSADDLMSAVIAAEKAGLPWFILGGGSNILVGDLGFRGLVIKNEAEKLVARGGRLVAESGVLMSKLAAFANENGLAGLEVFMSVPGTLGGAIFNNSHYRPERNEFIGNLVEEAEIITFDDPRRHFFGTLGQEPSLTSSSPPGQSTSRILSGSSSMTSKMASSDHLNYGNVKRKIVSRHWFKFGYDYSRLQEEKAVVLRVKFRLRRESPEVLRKRALALMRQRNQHQPIGSPSCGCMFKNPLRIEESDPSFAPTKSGLQTAEGSDPSGVSAGKLIDEAGMKGTKVGGVSVSQTHANFMVNDGTGKAADVLELMNRVKTRVKEFHGIELEPEIFMVGEFNHKPKKFNC